MSRKINFCAFDSENISDFLKEGLGEYLYSFNPLDRKYNFLETGLPLETLGVIQEFEFSQSYSDLSKSKYSHISENLDLVYGALSITQKDIVTYHEAMAKIIHDFLKIQNLDRLFDEDYFDFEWDILAQKNFTEHRQGYQREHFIHQIRNLYMGDKLVEELGFYDATQKVISDKNGSKISKYVFKKFLQFKNDEYSPISQLIKKISPHLEKEILNFDKYESLNILDLSREDIYITFDKFIDFLESKQIILSQDAAILRADLENFKFNEENCGSMISEYFNHLKNSQSPDIYQKFEENFKDFFIEHIKSEHYVIKWYTERYFYNYVIYASIYLSCLFHDLSYPVCYFLEFRHRLSNYSAASYMFTHNSMDSFDVLANKLSNSLLFTIVSYKEIQNRMKYKDQKYDHGVYSAIAFLLHFYESGLINTLSYEKQCAIELAAVAMYDHTLSFDCEEMKEENSHYSPYFSQNPIALILRLCDDLQEWDRRYFEFTGDSDMIFCPDCKMPMLKYLDEKHAPNKVPKYKYVCFCGHQDSHPFRKEEFLKRKIFVVRVSDKVTADIIEGPDDKKLLKFVVDYDLYKLLLMSRYKYAKYRLEDLNKLKKKLRYQDFSEQSGMHDTPTSIFIDYFMTSNPITIKIKILERWLLSQKELFPTQRDITQTLNSIKLPKTTGAYLNYCVNWMKKYNKRPTKSTIEKKINSISFCSDEIKNSIFKNIWWYLLVLKISLSFRGQEQLLNKEVAANGLISVLPIPKVNQGKEFDEISYKKYTEILVKDCLEQYSKEMIPSDDYDDIISFLSQKEYVEQYVSENEVYDAISKYCYTETYYKNDDPYFRPDFNNHCIFDDIPINYFSDLYIFQKMNEKIREKE